MLSEKFNQNVPIECKMWAQNINEEYGKEKITDIKKERLKEREIKRD